MIFEDSIFSPCYFKHHVENLLTEGQHMLTFQKLEKMLYAMCENLSTEPNFNFIETLRNWSWIWSIFTEF